MKLCISCLVYYISNIKAAIGGYFIRAAKNHKGKAISECQILNALKVTGHHWSE